MQKSFIPALLALFAAQASHAAQQTKHRAATPAPRPDAECEVLLTEAIPLKWVQKMNALGRANTPEAKRLRDIVQRLGFNAAALNQEIIRNHDNNYTVELAQGDISDQKQSGRCWIFAGLNMVRSHLIAQGIVPKDFEFSENYLYFYSMLEQSNHYLEQIIESTVGDKGNPTGKPQAASEQPDIQDGGTYEYFMFLVSKYGLVPKRLMPETKNSENTAALRAELKRRLAITAEELLEFAEGMGKGGSKLSNDDYLDAMRTIKSRGLDTIWRILATQLGDPPPLDAKFEFDSSATSDTKGLVTRTRSKAAAYTPKTFASDFADFDPTDYVVVSAAEDLSVGAHVDVDADAKMPAREGEEGATKALFLNVSLPRMEELTVKSIEAGYPVWFAADVTQDVDNKTGIMHPQIYDRAPLYDLSASEKRKTLSRRAANFFHIKEANHAMLLTGVDQPNRRKPVVKLKNENSWGSEVATAGVYHLYHQWYDENVFQIVVHKKFLSKEERAAWKLGPVEEDPR